jgi:hypothetical protein
MASSEKGWEERGEESKKKKQEKEEEKKKGRSRPRGLSNSATLE